MEQDILIKKEQENLLELKEENLLDKIFNSDLKNIQIGNNSFKILVKLK